MNTKERVQKLKERISNDVLHERDYDKLRIIEGLLESNLTIEEVEKIKKFLTERNIVKQFNL